MSTKNSKSNKLESRDKIISQTSILNIIANIAIASLKVIVGALVSSIAIISEGINNASDALTSVLTLLGSKLALKHPDRKHPFGYGRIEYLTSLVIAVLIIITGIEVLSSSVKLLFHPAELSTSISSIIIIAVTAVIKFSLGLYTIKMGKSTKSGALEAVGIDCRNDSFISLVTILSVLVYLVFGLSVDAYAGIFTSALIIKSGLDVLRETISELLGRPGEHELAKRLYKQIRETDCIIGAADMMLHNYGPDAWSGSVNIEIDHNMTVGEIYQQIHALQLRIMQEYNVTMVFGIYAVDNDHLEVVKLRKYIAKFVRSHMHVISYHALYLEEGTENIYCDLVLDYELKDWEALRQEFLDYMSEQYPKNQIILTLETEFV